MIVREKYLTAIRGFYDSDLIKVITGIRRSGKSVILETIINEIKEKTDNMCHQLISHPEKIEKRAEKPLKIILL